MFLKSLIIDKEVQFLKRLCKNSLLPLHQKRNEEKKHLPFGHGAQHVFKNLIMSKSRRSSDKEVRFLKNYVKNHYYHCVKSVTRKNTCFSDMKYNTFFLKKSIIMYTIFLSNKKCDGFSTQVKIIVS